MSSNCCNQALRKCILVGLNAISALWLNKKTINRANTFSTDVHFEELV